MKRFKKELSWLLVAALVVSSLVIGFGQLQTSAAQASGQLGTFRVSARTNAQNCAGTGTDADFELLFTYDDAGTWYSGNFVPDGDMEESQTNTWIVSNVPVRPITTIQFRMMNYANNDDWYWDWAKIEYCYDGTNYVQVGYNDGDGIANGTGYTINFNYNGAIDTTYMRTLTWSGNNGTVNGSSTYTVYAVQGATYPNNANNVPTSLARTGHTFTGWSPAIPTVCPQANTTYNAQWSINQYNIYFNGNGGSTPATITQNYGTAVSVPSSTREGHTFQGWSPACPTTMPANNTTCVAQWTVNSYNLTFNANGGTGGTGPTLTAYGASISPPSVSWTGHTFLGWSPTVPATMPAADSTYTAQWSLDSYTITWAANGGSGGGQNSCNYGAMPTPISAGTRTGYTFQGWSPTIVAATGPATYTAQWSLNSYTITWDAGGGTGGTTTSVNHGVTPTPPTVTRTGYTFTGWSPTIVAATAPATYTAQWSINNYWVYFDEVGGSTVSDINQNYGTTITAPANPTKAGYTFAGWSPAVPATMPAGNTTCVAQWTINQYTISFNSNGGSAVASITQNYGTAVTAPGNPTRTGYTFQGWSPACPTTMPANDTNCVAQWSINSYDITFDANGGTGGTGPTSMQYGAALSAPTVTRTGYTFNGWSPSVPSTVPAANTTYVAQWTINQYTVSFDSNGGSAVGSITQNYNTSVAEPAAPTKTGNTFAGWYSDAGLTTPVSWPFTLGAVNVTFYAKWTVNSYNLTFDANGGTGGTGPTLTAYGAAISAPTVTRTGYTFTGWSPAVAATMPAVDTTYTAQWSIDAYTIYFDEAGGSTVADITQDYGTTVTAPAAPTKTGYTFTGWSPAVPPVMPAEDTYCVAQWTINSYNLTFDANGGTGGTGPTSTEYGAAISAPTVTRTGYTFTGWDPAVAATMPAADTTYTAQWTVNSYNLTFDANGGTGGTGPTATEYGAAISAPTVTRTGYTFDGWDPAVAATMPAADTTYTAQWTAATVTITFDANGGTGGWSQSLTIGDPLVAPVVTRSGYSFDGWDPTVPATVPGTAATYTAQWIEIELIPGDGSATVINNTEFLIYGLEQYTTQEDFETLFVDVLGDGRIEVTPTVNGFGTGTQVDLIDNATDEILATYYIVIFGDVNGDGSASAIDADLIYNYESYLIEWDPVTEFFIFKAGDLSGDTSTSAIDADIIYNCESFLMWIDQTTGIAYEY